VELEGFTPLEDVASGLAFVALVIALAVGRAYVRRHAMSEEPSAKFWNWK
jgi:hypothetical protein